MNATDEVDGNISSSVLCYSGGQVWSYPFAANFTVTNHTVVCNVSDAASLVGSCSFNLLVQGM